MTSSRATYPRGWTGCRGAGWHWRIVIALGITWLLDGLETMLGGALVGILKDPRTLHLSDSEIGLSATVYLAGAVIGALIFGYATDRLGRKRLFFITLGVYLCRHRRDRVFLEFLELLPVSEPDGRGNWR